MLIIEQLQQAIFSPTETQVIAYILENKEQLAKQTTRQISEITYTSPAVLIKIAKKLGYSGWTELKEKLLEEVHYLNQHFTTINPNMPFEQTDGYLTITNKLAALYQTTIEDSAALMKYDSLKKATELMEQSSEIKVFGNNINVLLSREFALKMNRIKKYTSVCTTDGEQLYEAANCREQSCAIIISYSGETPRILELLPILKRRKIPIIAITSIGDNTLSKSSDCLLYISTREKLYSKIGHLSTNTSIHFILDSLYSCIFSKQYEQNLQHIIQISKLNDPRSSSIGIIKED
jgi:DNA-binding MurR/RpiR family transcriptional regulator